MKDLIKEIEKIIKLVKENNIKNNVDIIATLLALKIKIEQFENLEEQLGCPLDVVFKALKEGFIDSEYNLLRTAKSLEYRDNEWVLVMVGCRGKQWYFPLKDYGKTWWLNESEVKRNEKD